MSFLLLLPQNKKAHARLEALRGPTTLLVVNGRLGVFL